MVLALLTLIRRSTYGWDWDLQTTTPICLAKIRTNYRSVAQRYQQMLSINSAQEFPPPLWQRFPLSTSLMIFLKWGLGLRILKKPNVEDTEPNYVDKAVGVVLVPSSRHELRTPEPMKRT